MSQIVFARVLAFCRRDPFPSSGAGRKEAEDVSIIDRPALTAASPPAPLPKRPEKAGRSAPDESVRAIKRKDEDARAAPWPAAPGRSGPISHA